MLPKVKQGWVVSALIWGVVYTGQGFAATASEWNGLNSNNDLYDQNNWIPNTHVPGNTEVARFNSATPHINTKPTGTDIYFSVDSIYFDDKAQPFRFYFYNSTLSLAYNGIAGTHTDTYVKIYNTDNLNSPYSIFELYGPYNPLGNAVVKLNNLASFSGSYYNGYLSGISGYEMDVSGPFTISSGGKLIGVNSGIDTSSGGGGNDLANINYAQAVFDGTVTLGDNVLFSFSNSGENRSTNNTSQTNIATTEEGGIWIRDNFKAGDNLKLSISQLGKDTSTGVGGNETGYISGTSHLECDNDFDVGNNAVITITNSGTCTGTATASSNTTGYMSDEQFYVGGTLTGGDNLSILVTNYGEDSCNGVGDNQTGYVNSYQFRADGPVNLGNHTSITVENKGLFKGTASTSSNSVGYISGDQLHFSDTFQAGDFLSIAVTNYGEDHGSGVDNNNVGYVNGGQLVFVGACTVGDNATITLKNTGISTTSALDSVGVLSGEQLTSGLGFTAGKNLTITATNNGTISGNSTAVGYVSGCQMNFVQDFTADDGTFLSAFNLGDGTVFGSQILFQQGFNILSGKATFQAFNDGAISAYGIEVQQGSGGNVDIVLGNSSLYVSSPATDFTIASLTGDTTSFVKSQPLLIINTDTSVNATFDGHIQDFSGPSSLTKTGKGTQKLTNTNPMQGLTTVHEGTLILTGSLGGAMNIDADGILKGTGSVAGDVVNVGAISPGESIGTIHFLSKYINNDGTYIVEVSGTGASDLISVTGDVELNGGLIIVSTVDGTYRFQDRYTIVETEGTRTGFYTGATAISSFVQPLVTYDDQHVYLSLLTDIKKAANSANQLAIATQLDGIVNPTDKQNLLLSEIVDLPADEAREALDSLSGYQHAADLITTQMINRQFIRRLYDPVRSIVTTEPCSCCDCSCDPCYNSCCPDIVGWFDIGGTFINIQGESHAHGLKSTGYNINLGIQTTLCQAWTLGIAGAYEEDRLDFKHSAGSERCETWLVGLYGLYRPSCFYALADFIYGNSTNHLNRTIRAGSLHYKAKSNPDTYQYTFYGEIGVDFNQCGCLLQPFFGIETGTFHRKHVRESYASGWGLEVEKRSRTLTSTRLGVHITSHDVFNCGGNLSFDLAWNYLVSDLKNRVHERFEHFGDPFAIEWTKFDRSSVDYALTFSEPILYNLTGYIEGSGESWRNANFFSVLAGLEYCW